jgi:eukaryotic-like serine/threonine-protein kinase
MQEQTIFTEALELDDPAQRAAFLDAACAGEPARRERIERLLSHASASGEPATLDKPATETPGMVVGPYKLLEQIGEGGMGTVWMAQQTQPVKRLVALKLIKAGMDSKALIARFEAERQALALMDHPNIAKVLDGGTTCTVASDPWPEAIEKPPASAQLTTDDWPLTASSRPYFVMELVKGVRITKYCDEHHLTPRERLELFIPVCHAIEHAHQKGIIHRDLKPSNVLVALYDGTPVPKVIDFGVAKAAGQLLTEKTLVTGFGAIVGTLEYMSPEQAEINQLDVDTRSDIYALGVLLYELLTGSPPFSRKELATAGLMEMLRVIREDEPSKPSTKLSSSDALPTLSANRGTEPAKLTRLMRGELDWIVMKALEKQRNRRYQTANGIADDLRRYLADEPVQACPPSAGYRLKKFVRRNKGPVVAAAIVLLTLVGGIVGTTLGLVRAEQARQAEAERAEEERQAKEDAQKRLTQVEAGTEILAAVFRDLNPIAAELAGVTPRDLLARRLAEAARQLEGEAVGDPLVVARLQHLLGISLRELAHPEQAEEVLVKAGRTRERLLGADDLDTVATKHHLAAAYRDQRKYALAEALFNEVLSSRTAQLGTDHRDTLATKHHFAWLYHKQAKYALAEPLCKEVLAIRTVKLGADHLETLATKHLLGVLYNAERKFDLAEAVLREVVAGRTAGLKADHLDIASSRHYLALVYWSQRKYAPAEELFEKVVAVRSARLGADAPITLDSQRLLAMVYCDQGKYAQAEPLYKELVAVWCAKVGPNHGETLYRQHDLATVYRYMKNFKQAIPLLEDTLQRCKASEHPATLGVQADLGASYRDVERFADAIPLLEEVHRTGRNEPGLAWVANALLAAYLGAGKTAEVIALATEQVRAAREQFPADSPERAAALTDAGKALQDAKAYAAAEAVFQEVLVARTAKLGADHPETIYSRDTLGILYSSMNKLDQSISLLAESLEQRKAQLGSDHPEIRGRQVSLGARYCEAGRFAEGLPLIEAVHKKGRTDPHPAWVRHLLLTAYVQAGKAPEATALVAERIGDARGRWAAHSLQLFEALADAGKTLLEVKAYVAAEPLLRESLSFGEKETDQAWDIHQARSLLGAALLGQHKYADAEPLLVQGYEGMKERAAKLGADDPRGLTTALERIVQLYDAWDRKDQADQWRRKLEAHKVKQSGAKGQESEKKPN